VLVPSVPVHNDDLLATVAPHFVGSLLRRSSCIRALYATVPG
jgi:hypothetical protein